MGDFFTNVRRQTGVLPCNSSGQVAASAVVNEGPCLLTGIKIVTDGTNDATVEIYDNTSAAGKIVDKFIVAGDENYGGAIYGKSPIVMHGGIYVALAGTGATCYVFYFKGAIQDFDDTWGQW